MVADRGFGFVRDSETKEDYFLHRSSCEPQQIFDALNDLMTAADPQPVLSFRVSSSPKGPRAFEVRYATEQEAESYDDAQGNV